MPAWVWWLGSTAFVFLTLVGLLAGAAFAGAKAEAIFIGVYLLISIPISAVILVVSMILSSAIVGGIEFGEVHVVIPKLLGLLFIVNLVSLIPFVGWFIALLVWVGGLMSLFKLDMQETRILVAVNWGLNCLVRLALLRMFLAIAQRGAGG